MNSIRKKLSDSRGESMLMAMLLLLVAVIASSVMLSAAVTAANTSRSDHDQQQAMLTVTSAAELMQDNFSVSAYSVVTLYTINDDHTLTAQPPIYKEAEGAFSGILNDAMAALNQSPNVPYEGSFQLTAEGYDPVDIQLRISRTALNSTTRDTLTALFSTEKARILLTMNGLHELVRQTDATTGRIQQDTVTVKWVPDTIRRPANEDL